MSATLSTERERRLRYILAGVVALGLVALMIVGHQARKAEATDRAAASAMNTARTSVPAILSYTDSGLSAHLQTNRRLMTADYAQRYAAMVRKRVIPHARRFGVANQVGVVSVGTVRSTPDSAVVLVFANQTTRTKEKPDGITQGTRLEVTLQRTGGRWLVDDMKPL